MSLHPEIERLLGAFERRRRRLLLLRGLLGGAAALLLGTLLAVLVDAPLVLEDEPRVVIAGLVYGGVASAFGWCAFRHFNLGSRVNVAAVLEAMAPQLRGSFLAAVELVPSAGEVDSPAFRGELQEQTARRIQGISVPGLLPLNLLKKDLRLLLGAALALGCGFALDGSRFGWRCARALLPLANFERLSDAVITVLQPEPIEGIVPAEEPLPVAVSVVGPDQVEPLLLSRQPDGSKLRIPMRAAGPGRFEANLPVDNVPLVYQIRAGYSLTRKFRLEPRPRPRVASYLLTYHYPEYTGLPQHKVASLDGAVSALEGTTVDLEFMPDQAVATGSLALTLGRTNRELPLAGESGGGGDTGRLRASFEITEGGAYTVRMVSAETGLKSAAGPQHAIHIELDAPPKLVLDLPAQDVVVPLGDKVPLEGAAEDDFGLAGVQLEFRRNETGWRRDPLGEMVGREFPIRTAFDPLSEKARPGDVWSVRFSATDARGQRGESRTLRIAIAPPGTVARPDRALAAQRALYKRVKELATESAEAASSLEKLKSQTERGAPDDLKASEALVRGQQALEKSVQAAEAARSQLLDALQQAASRQPQAEEAVLRQEARVLGAAQAGDLPAALKALEQLRPMADNKAASVEAARFAHEAAAAGANNARLVEESVRTRLDAMEAAALAPAARALSAELAKNQVEAAQPAAAEGRSPEQEEALRRQQVNQTLSSQMQGQLQKLAERAQPVAAAVRPALDELRRSQAAAEKALQAAVATEGAQAAAPLDAAANALSKSLDRSATSLEAASPALKAAAERAQAALARADRNAGEILESNGREIGALAAKQNLPAGLREAEAAIRAAAAAEVLRANAEVASVGKDAAPKLARAQMLAAAALEAPPEASSPLAALGSQAAELAKALKPVEAAAATDSALKKAENLVEQIERQNGPPSPAQMAERKRLKDDVQNLPKQIRDARLPELAATKAREAGDALAGDATAGLMKAVEAFKAGSEAVAETADKALAEIAKKAPSLAKQMERLAAKAARDAESTAALAKKASAGADQASGQPAERADVKDGEKPGEKPGEQPGNRGGDEAGLNVALRAGSELERKLDQLRQALRTEANAQDARTASGREAARDADGAAVQVKDAGTRAQAALQQAATRAAERQPLLEKAAAFQRQGAEQLRSLAENFQKLDSADPAERAAARQALRAGDKAAGEATRLDARQERMAELAKLAELAKQAPEAALAKAEAMEAANPQGTADTPPGAGEAPSEGTSPQEGSGKAEGSPQGNKSKSGPAEGQGAAASQLAQQAKAELADALAALKEGGEKNAERAAQSLSNAVDAQAAADRGERAQEGAAAAAGANSNNGLAGMADTGSQGLPPEKRGAAGEWGNLPKRLATDMVEGRRESAPSEYREAVEAYFRAVAERARGGAGRQ
jgi:hypothetical protein